jgi:4-alpha-glucanotransferase
VPVQDIFGWRDRVNLPASMDDKNWTYRLPWPSDRLDDQREACDRSERLRDWGRRWNRGTAATGSEPD